MNNLYDFEYLYLQWTPDYVLGTAEICLWDFENVLGTFENFTRERYRIHFVDFDGNAFPFVGALRQELRLYQRTCGVGSINGCAGWVVHELVDF